MTEDVGRAGTSSSARRPGPVVATIAAVALLMGGGTAVVVGLSGRDATPPPPPLSAPSGETPSSGPSQPTSPSASASVPQLTSPPAPQPTEQATPVAAPVAVSIPAIGVSSDLLHLGLNPDGTLQVPEGADFDTAAWYDGSPRPGEVGPAVIEGHVSSSTSGPSVFFDLSRLQVGDTVEVTGRDGTVATFEVYALQQFPKDSFPTVQVYGHTTGPELRLITCGGTITESTGRFKDNIIVFASEV